MKGIFKVIISALVILIVFFLYPYYLDKRKIEKAHDKFIQEGINMELEGFEFGISKNEFKDKYSVNLDSLDYHWQTSYINNDKMIIPSFHGLEVSKEQFIFRENVFNRSFIKTDIFSSIFLNIKDSSFENFIRLKDDFDMYKDQRHSQYDSNEHLDIYYRYKTNKYLEIELHYNKRKIKGKETEHILISFGINENENIF